MPNEAEERAPRAWLLSWAAYALTLAACGGSQAVPAEDTAAVTAPEPTPTSETMGGEHDEAPPEDPVAVVSEADAEPEAPPEAVDADEPPGSTTPACGAEDCPWLHPPDDPAERRRWIRRWSARFRNPDVPEGYDGERVWLRFRAGRVLDALGAIEVGMTRRQVIRLLGRPDRNEVREDYWTYELSPVATFDVQFENGRVTDAGYAADSPPPDDI